MGLKEIFIHRIRDLDSALRLKRKSRVILYVMLRQFFKLLNINEDKIKNIIKDNYTELYGYIFFTRKSKLDFLFFSKFYEPETTKLYFKDLEACF